MPRFLRIVVLFVTILNLYPALSQPACDKDKSCVGRAIQFTETTGRGAHFIEVSGYAITDRKQTSMTVEMWVKTNRVNNTKQFLGGIWGPAFDNNDVWQLYINQNNDLVFEVNGDGTKLRDIDNTKTSIPFAPYFNTWTHIAAVFDGANKSVSLYINSVLSAGPDSNSLYPARYLRPPDKSGLKLLFGSINGLSDNPSSNRTFRGQMDEIKIWNKILTPEEIYCNMSKSLAFNTPGLQLYYRCNEADGVVYNCDATGKGFTGTMLSGTKCVPSDRKVEQKVIVSPSSFNEPIRCEFKKSYTVTITDTSVCGSSVTFLMDNIDKNAFTVSPTSATLSPNTPVSVTVTVQSAIVGPITADLRIRPTNSCGQEIIVPFRFDRSTELRFPRTGLNFDTLYVGCKEQTFRDTSFRICNSSDSLGQPRNVSITSITNKIPGRFSIVSPALPKSLQPGECVDIVVRFTVTDTSANFFDTLQITTTDKCPPGNIIIPMRGIVREVLSVTNEAGTKRLDSVRWGVQCINNLSDPSMWVWKNLTSRIITIDTIIVPKGFTGRKLGNKPKLNPNTGYSANYFRFFPLVSGKYNDSAIIRYTLTGINCTFEKKIYLSGTGFEAKVRWTARIIDSGDCIVGQQKRIIASIKNEAPDPLNLSFYFEVGEVFFFPGGRSLNIAPGETKNVLIDFKPLKDSQYVDKLCLFETRCFTTDCIQVKGRGILETFRFNPIMMKTENVLGCSDQLDTLDILNIAGSDQRVNAFSLIDASGKFTVISPSNYASLDTTIAKDDKLRFVFKYWPNDTTKDRADRAFLNFSSRNVKWSAPLYGTSATPKLYITPLTTFGTLEVGDSTRKTILIENVSFLPVQLDSLDIPNGFRVTKMNKSLPVILNPRDSILVEIEFKPDTTKQYNGIITAFSGFPCPMYQQATLRGRAITIPLEVPISIMNWGYVKPCDCVERRLPLVNQSIVHSMIIDSLIIDAGALPNATPQFWRWSSTYSPNGILPYSIPKEKTDTVSIYFCPRTPAEDKYITCAAQVRIKAHGSGWSRDNFKVILAGKRALTYKPEPISIVFPPTPVDTTLTPQFARVTIPSFDKNPDQFPIVIDSVSFEPNERVFTALQPAGTPFVPVTMRSGDTLYIRIAFKPRSPRLYTARMVLHVSEPCKEKDTTILISGLGQANPFGLNMTFDNKRIIPDTFSTSQCDTLRVPVFTSRDIPADIADISCRLSHDTTKIRFVGLDSKYLDSTCFAEFPPSYSAFNSGNGGTMIKIKNFCSVDSVAPIFTAKFVSISGKRAQSLISIDSVFFDTERIILYRIYAEPDTAIGIIKQSSIAVLNSIQFDSVRILDCVDKDIAITNDGDLPVLIDTMLNLPMDVTIVTSTYPKDSLLYPGDTARISLRYCPRSTHDFRTNSKVISRFPCTLIDTASIAGTGYAPDKDIAFTLGPSLLLPDTVKATLGDTVIVPIMIEDDFSTSYKGITYNLQSVSFMSAIRYNPRALQFITMQSTTYPNSRVNFNSAPGIAAVTVSKADSIKKGELAYAVFVVAVPDSALTSLYLETSDIITDSLPFIDVIPINDNIPCIITGKCGISTLKFSDVLPNLMQNIPNPVQGKTTIEYSFQEKTPYTLSLYSSDGKLIKIIAESKQAIEGGNYSTELDAATLQPGVYFYVLQAGNYRSARKLQIVH